MCCRTHAADMAPAYANYSVPSNHPSNFGQLRITTNPAFSNQIQVQAAGFIEGYLTAGEALGGTKGSHTQQMQSGPFATDGCMLCFRPVTFELLGPCKG